VPIYEYECAACDKVFEVQQHMTDHPLETCPDCGGSVRKLVSMSSFQLKGRGWYADGYCGQSNGKGQTAVRPPRVKTVSRWPRKRAVRRPRRARPAATAARAARLRPEIFFNLRLRGLPPGRVRLRIFSAPWFMAW